MNYSRPEPIPPTTFPSPVTDADMERLHLTPSQKRWADIKMAGLDRKDFRRRFKCSRFAMLLRLIAEPAQNKAARDYEIRRAFRTVKV